MWKEPDLKRHAAIAAQRRAQERERERNASRFTIRRTRAEVKIRSESSEPAIAPARIVLNDVSPKGMTFLVGSSLPVGELAQITIEEPRRIYVKAKIVASQPYGLGGRVISAEPFSYRIAVTFIFSTEDEERDFKSFCDELALEVLRT